MHDVPVTVVAFDESGNTGDNLLDEVQPIYSLASVALDAAEAAAVIAEVAPAFDGELKYSDLRIREDGREIILGLLGSGAIRGETARVTPMHKPFTVVARLFDYLMETTLHEGGFQVYERGLHIMFVNILYRGAPAACGAENWRALLSAFVAACRAATDDRLDAYIAAHAVCRASSTDAMTNQFLDLVPLSRDALRSRIGLDQGRGIGARDMLDPAVTSLIEHCMRWPERVGRIRIRHDETSVVERWKEKLAVLASPAANDEVGRYWSERMPLPLDVEAIELVSSAEHPEVQIADIVAGASVTWLAQFVGRADYREFIDALGRTALPHIVENEVWPIPLVDGARF